MRSILLAVFIFLMIVSSAQAKLHQQTIEYKQGDIILEGYLSYEDNLTGKRPGILVVHEWKGLDAYVKMRADQLAKLGYVAFAADIYGKGVRPQTPQEAGVEASKYKNDRSLLRQRATAGLDQLKAQSNVDGTKLAAMGYCFGGMTVLELARSGADLKGVVSFHGNLNTPNAADAKNIKARVMILHGAEDPFVPPTEVGAFIKEMDNANVAYQIIKYHGAVHGFTNPANTGEIKGALYNEDADKMSWQEMKKFFKEIFK